MSFLISLSEKQSGSYNCSKYLTSRQVLLLKAEIEPSWDELIIADQNGKKVTIFTFPEKLKHLCCMHKDGKF